MQTIVHLYRLTDAQGNEDAVIVDSDAVLSAGENVRLQES